MRSFTILSIIVALAFATAEPINVSMQGFLGDNGDTTDLTAVFGVEPVESVEQQNVAKAACNTGDCACWCIKYALNNRFRYWRAWCQSASSCRCDVWN